MLNNYAREILETQLDDMWTNLEGNPYRICKGCGRAEPGISVAGHSEDCRFLAIEHLLNDNPTKPAFSITIDGLDQWVMLNIKDKTAELQCPEWEYPLFDEEQLSSIASRFFEHHFTVGS